MQKPLLVTFVMYCSMNHASLLRFLTPPDTMGSWCHDETMNHDWTLPLARLHDSIKISCKLPSSGTSASDELETGVVGVRCDSRNTFERDLLSINLIACRRIPERRGTHGSDCHVHTRHTGHVASEFSDSRQPGLIADHSFCQFPSVTENLNNMFGTTVQLMRSQLRYLRERE